MSPPSMSTAPHVPGTLGRSLCHGTHRLALLGKHLSPTLVESFEATQSLVGIQTSEFLIQTGHAVRIFWRQPPLPTLEASDSEGF